MGCCHTVVNSQGMIHGPVFTKKTENKDRQFDDFVVTDGTVGCRNDNLRWHKWRESFEWV